MPSDHRDFTIAKLIDASTPSQGQPVTFTYTVSQPSDNPRPDGTSNTLMIGERLDEDDPYVLTAIQHGAVDTLQTGFGGGIVVASGDVNGDSSQLDARIGAWIMDTTYETGSHALYQDVVVPPPPETGGPAVAMETITIANEGLWLI